MQADFSRPTLAIDTSTGYLSLALHSDGQTLLHHVEAGNRQSEQILPQIGALFAQAGISAADLGAIVYAQGPGAFTGLRIGAGVAQGLAAPFATPLIGVPCLDAVACQISAPCVLAATDARMGEVFYAWFNTQTHSRLSDDMVGKAADIQVLEGATQPRGVGNAFDLYAEAMPFTGRITMPTAADYLRLAMTDRYDACGAEAVHLRYVRNKVALTAAEQAARHA